MMRISLKRSFDIILSLVLLVITLPLFFLALTLTLLDGHKNPFFMQRRVGLHCKEFIIYKFRTMKNRPDGSPILELSLIAKFVRSSGIDELPQLLNILKGDMSIVGPRPHSLADAERWGAIDTRYFKRYAVRPGLLCLVEITPLHFMSQTPIHVKARTTLDLLYIKNASLLLDLKILYKAFFYIIKSVTGSMPSPSAAFSIQPVQITFTKYLSGININV